MQPFEIKWQDSEKSVLVWQYPDRYSPEGLASAGKISVQMLMTTPAPRVDVVMILNQSDLDGKSNFLNNLNSLIEQMPPKVSLFAIVAPRMYGRIMMTTLKATKGGDLIRQLRFAASTDEAVNLIQGMRVCPA